LGIVDGSPVKLHLNGAVLDVIARLDEKVPENVVIVPRSMGIPISGPAPIEIEAIERVTAGGISGVGPDA
jgi:hypothetical protein